MEAVTVFDIFSSGREWHLAPHGRDDRLRIVRSDVHELEILTESMAGHDTVIHLASNPDIARAMTQPSVDFDEGTLLTHHVVEAARLSGTRRILYASGSGVYGDLGDQEATEDHGPLIPVSTYGASKLAGEALISSYCHMFGHVAAFPIRERRRPPSDPRCGVRLRPPIAGGPERAPHPGGRVTEQVLHPRPRRRSSRPAGREGGPRPFSAYNVATGDYLTVTEIAELAVEVVGGKPGSTAFSYSGGDRGWKGDVPVVRIDTSKIRSLGWSNERTAAQAITASMASMVDDARAGRLTLRRGRRRSPRARPVPVTSVGSDGGSRRMGELPPGATGLHPPEVTGASLTSGAVRAKLERLPAELAQGGGFQVSGERGLRIKVFADGADLESILELARNPMIAGFTTNPTLMRKSGVTDYEGFARKVLEHVPDRPISLEVIADDPGEMARQARLLASWGDNVCVKIPVTETNGRSCAPLIRELSEEGLTLNVTAILSLDQVRTVVKALEPSRRAIVSVFAGRVADTGRDPVPLMRSALEILAPHPGLELLWASPREVLNVVQAESIGCHIVTVTHDLLAKISGLGRDLDEVSLDTVRMFHDDARHSGFLL